MEITVINLILCLIIFGMGIWDYIKKKDNVTLLLGVAFGLFGISHLMTILKLSGNLDIFLIIIRLIAYLLVIFSLYKLVKRK